MEFFIVANSFAAPFVSDESTSYVKAESAKLALEKFASEYGHPAGLYVARAYKSADDYHKGNPHLTEWQSNKLQAIENAKPDEGGYSVFSQDAVHVEVDGKQIAVENSRGGSVITKENK